MASFLGSSRRIESVPIRVVLLLALSVVSSMVVALAHPAPVLGQSAAASCGVDVALVVDSSGSVDSSELALMQDAFAGFVDAFLAGTPTEMAVVEFDRRARVLQGFTGDAVALRAAIDSFESGGRTNWQDGLLEARRLFPHRDAPDLIVFASDGRPNKVNGSKELDRAAALAAAVVEADAAKAAGARIIAIGIGDRLKVDKLAAIASSPDDVYTTGFDALADTLADLAGELCAQPGASCGVDVALVVDSSGSVDSSELALMQDAFAGFVDAFLAGTPTEMAVVEFDRRARVLQGFTGDAVALRAAIDSFESGGRTNWQDGLLEARRLFPHRDAPDLIVFASDGRPNKVNGSKELDRAAALAAAVVEADAAKAAGARIIAIGIGDRLKVDKLAAIASSPDDVYTTGFDALADTLADLAEELCGGTIAVTKLIDADGDLGTSDDQVPGEGWTFTADVADGEAIPPAAVTGASGSVVFTITSDGATVDVFESGVPGYELLDASCVGATENGASNLLDGITGIVVGELDAVVCTFINSPESVTTR